MTMRTRSYINEYCSFSNQQENITVEFKKVPILGSLKDSYKQTSYECENSECSMNGSSDCPIFQSANP